MRVIARLVSSVAPETLAPPVGERILAEAIAATFGLSPELHIQSSGRREGHLFLLVSESGFFTNPDRLRLDLGDRRPGETAYILARAPADDTWRYCGAAHWLEDQSQWRVPELDFATWRALGASRDCSRRLPDAAKARANELLDALVNQFGLGGWIQQGTKRCRLVARTASGVRIDGGEGGFAARTVSVTDVAWVLLAADDVTKNGGLLDEARVNRLRYLDGTPKGSTRWIDTGWGILIAGAVSR